MASGLALFCPAMSMAVPWPTDEKSTGVPIDSAAAPCFAISLAGTWPWSWSITTNASQSLRGSKVSAPIGPINSMSSPRQASMAGAMRSISSVPKRPDSPAWGLTPDTPIRGRT